MTVDGPNPHLGRVQGPDRAPDRPERPTGTDPTAFRRILEQLEAIGRRDDATGVDPADSDEPAADLRALQDDLRRADEDYQQVMDLRARLEDAFRRAQDD